MKIKILLFLSLIFTLNKSYAQEVCATSTPSNYNTYENEMKLNQKFNLNQPVCINIFFHIVRSSNGSGGYNPTQLNLIIDNLNKNYNQFDIYFNNIGFDYIDNSNYLQISENEQSSLAQINNKSNAINYYIVDSLWNVEAGYVAWTALSIPSNRLIIRSDRVLEATSPHEVGHCLNLLHTFETSTCVEAINGSNCNTCGDKVCDTPADGNVYNNNGYSPDLTNIMSYYFNRDHFTLGQSERMKSAIFSNPMLQQLIGNSCTFTKINGADNICNSEQDYTLTGSNLPSPVWTISNNLTFISSNSNSIKVKPNIGVVGQAFVKAVFGTREITKYIWLGAPSVSYNVFTNEEGTVAFYNLSPGSNNLSLSEMGINTNNITCNINFIPSFSTVLNSGNCLSGSMQAHPMNTTNYRVGMQIEAFNISNGCGNTGAAGSMSVENINFNPNPIAVFSVCPYPTTDVINISRNSQAKRNSSIFTNIELLNNTGIKVHSIKTLNNNISIRTNNLPKGIYTLIINFESNKETHQIIIQ